MSTSRIEFAAGDVIFREGDPPTTAFLVEQGTVEVSTKRELEDRVLGHLGPGDLLGEMAVIDSSPRTATARALTDCTLLSVDQAQIHERLENADPIVRALLRGQLVRYRSALAALRGAQSSAPQPPPPPASLQDSADDLDDSAIGKIRLETALKDALEQRALEVRFQPIYDIAEDRISGYEALIRWNHPDRGPISPAEFIALAEETSLIVPVGKYVFEEVCAALAALQGHGIGPLPFVSVNVSSRQLETDDVLQMVHEIAQEHRVPREALKIEVTESLTMDIVKVGALIGRSHELGLKVALDDFGTGYSNLGHLHKLHFDTVKLDQGFVRQMIHAPRCLAIVKAITTMIRELDADMIAEGVEEQAQLDVLRGLGCKYAQGYLIGKPQTRAEMIAAQTKPALSLVATNAPERRIAP